MLPNYDKGRLRGVWLFARLGRQCPRRQRGGCGGRAAEAASEEASAKPKARAPKKCPKPNGVYVICDVVYYVYMLYIYIITQYIYISHISIYIVYSI